MNRAELQQIAEPRLRESKTLLTEGFPDGEYYLAGYAVECALKACISKRTREHDFPEKKLVNDSDTHDLGKLLQLAELKVELDTAVQADPAMKAILDTIQDWSEASRYERKTLQEATDLLEAVEDGIGGLLPWIRLRW
ncbi:MAG TPA: HEPN domain-containing protein [Terracidiphilus sp.]|jgi:HEPN domain-containing protein|nr:HEPN domain-containing protein [Terracidiphilus sp.]